MKIQKGTYNGKSVHYLTRKSRWFADGCIIPKYKPLIRLLLLCMAISQLISFDYPYAYACLYALWCHPDYVIYVSFKDEWDKRGITEHEYLHMMVMENCINRPDMIKYFWKSLDKLDRSFVGHSQFTKKVFTEDMVANIKIDIDGITV